VHRAVRRAVRERARGGARASRSGRGADPLATSRAQLGLALKGLKGGRKRASNGAPE